MSKITLFLFFFQYFVYAQKIIVTNSIDKTPINNVLFFSKFGEYIGKTDDQGKISKEYIEKAGQFVLIHPTIKPDTISFSNIVNEEVEIKQTKKQPIPKFDSQYSDKEYISLVGFFNIYNTSSGVFDNYIDGIVQFIFEKATLTYKSHRIIEYRNFKYFKNVSEETPFIRFSGISQFPISGDIDNLAKTEYNLEKNFNNDKNQLVIKSIDSLYNSKDGRKVFGYRFSNLSKEVVYTFSKDSIDIAELFNYSKVVNIEAKHDMHSKFTKYFSMTNFYPLEINYVNKNEIKKGVKLKNNKSNYFSSYWQNDFFTTLINYLSQKSLYDLSFMKNEKK